MASAVRTLCRQAARVSAISLRVRRAAIPSQWRYLTAASCPAWKINTLSFQQSKLHPLAVVPRRGYAEELTSQELTERVLNVLKLFDKIDPSKVLCQLDLVTSE